MYLVCARDLLAYYFGCWTQTIFVCRLSHISFRSIIYIFSSWLIFRFFLSLCHLHCRCHPYCTVRPTVILSLSFHSWRKPVIHIFYFTYFFHSLFKYIELGPNNIELGLSICSIFSIVYRTYTIKRIVKLYTHDHLGPSAIRDN